LENLDNSCRNKYHKKEQENGLPERDVKEIVRGKDGERKGFIQRLLQPENT